MFIRINLDKENFNISKEINKIQRHIKKSTKKSLADDLSKRLLEVKSRNKIAVLEWIVKKCDLQYKDMKKRATNKKWKRNWINVLFRA